MTEYLSTNEKDTRDHEQEEISADEVQVNNTTVQAVQAEVARLQGSMAREIRASEIEARQSLLGLVSAENVRTSDGVVGLAQTSVLHLSNSTAIATRAQDVVCKDSTVTVMYTDRAQLSETQNLLMVARTVEGGPVRTGILLAGQVNAPVETMVDTPRAMFAGLTAGITVGLVLLVGKMLSQLRRHRKS